MFKILKKLLPQSYTLNTANKPMHAGEIYYLWESLTTSYHVLSLAETYLMATQDTVLHGILQGVIQGVKIFRIPKLENLLKDAGFVVPTHPSSKTLQSKPGVGQLITLTDDEVITVMYATSRAILNQDARAIGVATSDVSLVELFKDLLEDSMRIHEALLTIGMSRQILIVPPKATATVNGMDMTEVSALWTELDYRHSSISLLETFLNNTNDKELKKILNDGLQKTVFPQLDKIETLLKDEGLTIPARPADRNEQKPDNLKSKIILNDNEVIGLFLLSTQVAINHHIRAYSEVLKEDLKDLFKSFIKQEIKNLEIAIALSKKRGAILDPPNVTSKKG